MGAIHLRLPSSLPPTQVKELARSYFAGLPDYMPWATDARVERGDLVAEKETVDSACLCVPWLLPSGGEANGQSPVMITTATLVEKEEPYRLMIELARGKVNQVRNQAADWQSGGLILPEEVEKLIRDTSVTFGHAVCRQDQAKADELAADALRHALSTSDALVTTYIDQVFQARQQRFSRLPTRLACAVPGEVPPPEMTEAFTTAFNTVRFPLVWNEVEAQASVYNWDALDAKIAWAKQAGLAIEIGPLIDFAPGQLPRWLGDASGDPQSLANLMLDYIEAAISRYLHDVRHWVLTAASNEATGLDVDEEDVIWINSQLLTAAQQLHPDGEFAIALAKPWGEGFTAQGRCYSPFVFADALLRTRANLTALELEIVTGVTPRGSQARDALDVSRLLDLYSLLGIPLQVTLGAPSAGGTDANAHPSFQADEALQATHNPASQAAWAGRLVNLTTCKPYMAGVGWAHWSDAAPHAFPHAGLVDAQGKPKPALDEIRALRVQRLR